MTTTGLAQITTNDQFATIQPDGNADDREEAISEITQQQTDAVKKIVELQKTTLEQPHLSTEEKTTEDFQSPEDALGARHNERLAAEDFKLKCEYYLKLNGYRPEQQNPASQQLKQTWPPQIKRGNVKDVTQNNKVNSNSYIFLHNAETYDPSFFSLYAQNNLANSDSKFVNKDQNDVQNQSEKTQSQSSQTQNKFLQYVPQTLLNYFTTVPHNEYEALDQYVPPSRQHYYYSLNKSPMKVTQQDTINNKIKDQEIHQYDGYVDTNKHAVASSTTNDENQNIFAENFPRDQTTKYVKLEPVVLQKTLITDGKTLYYWYKTVPDYRLQSELHSTSHMKPSSNVNIQDSNVQESNYITNTIPTTARTTEAHVTKITTTTQNPASNGDKVKNSYQHQLRFVIPMPYPKPEVISKYPWELDPYAYYPKEVQPSYMNLPVRYAPTYHVIRSLNVPNGVTGQDVARSKMEEVSIT